MGLIPGNTGVATTFPDGFLVGNGSVTAPTFRFQDTGTGFYRKAADSLGIAAAGVEVGSFTSAGAWTMGPANTSNLQVLNGTAAIDGGTAVSSILEWRSTVNAASRRYQWRQDIDAYGDFGLLGGGASNTATPNVKFIYVTAAGALTLGPSGFSGDHAVRGRLTLGTSTATTGGILISNGSNNTNATCIEFRGYNGTNTGTISTFVNTTTYATSSDQRLKEDLGEWHGLEIVAQIKSRKFKWNSTNLVQLGYFAQELYEVFPQAVKVGGENVDSEPWGVDYGKITPVLVKAIQEQQALIVSLTSRILALETP